jgi:ferritin-like metal-binding protein YciE
MELNPPQELVDVQDACLADEAEHLEMAGYTSLVKLALELGESDIAQMLRENQRSEERLCALLEDEMPTLLALVHQQGRKAA